jgi:hypothetical protein
MAIRNLATSRPDPELVGGKMRPTHVLCLLAFALITGCSSCGPTDRQQVLAEEYDRTCTDHDDCMLIIEGDYCDCLGCPNAAIARSDRDAYEEDVESAEGACFFRERKICGALEPQRTRRQAASCGTLQALCVEGTCEAIDADRPRGLPSACTTDDDCVAVPPDYCRPCSCEIALNQEGYQLALAIKERTSCSPDAECECVDGGPPQCINGRCYANTDGDQCGITTWDASTCQ